MAQRRTFLKNLLPPERTCEMSRRARRRHRASKHEPAPATPRAQPTAASPPARPTRRSWRMIATATVMVAGFATAGYFAAGHFSKTPALAGVPPKVVEGDGVAGPKGMVWVPGGEFLMGSDHKLAQPNERPAH